MQAKRRDADAKEVKQMQESGKNFDDVYATSQYAKFNTLNEDEWETKTHTPNFFSKIFGGKKDQTYKVRKNLHVPPPEYKRFANTPELNPPDLSESEEGSESDEDDLLKEERSSLLNENAEESPNIMDTAFNYGHKKKKRRH